MSEPFIFIGTHRLKEGKLEAFRQTCAGLADFVEANEPRVIAFDAYANEEGDEVSIVQVHPDADSMLFHMELLQEHIAGASQEDGPLDVTTSIQIYGTPTDTVLEMIRQFNPAGPPLVVKPLPMAGFVRSRADSRAATTGWAVDSGE